MSDLESHRIRLRSAALAAAARGWHVFPLQPGTTEPAVRNWADRATTSTWRIMRCWETGPYNVGVAPCASNLLVLDLMEAAGHQPPPHYRIPGVHDGADVLALLLEERQALLPVQTYSVTGPSNRLHYYFNRPARTCAPTSPPPLAWRVEIRCTGSYVPAAGSFTDAGPYTVLHDADPEPCPSWLTEALAQPPR